MNKFDGNIEKFREWIFDLTVALGCVDEKLMRELKRLLGRKDIGDDPEKWEIDPAWLEAQGVDVEERKVRRPTGVIEEGTDATPPAPPAAVEEAKDGDLVDLFDDKPPPAQG